MSTIDDKWKKFKEKEEELLRMNEEVDKKRMKLRQDNDQKGAGKPQDGEEDFDLDDKLLNDDLDFEGAGEDEEQQDDHNNNNNNNDDDDDQYNDDQDDGYNNKNDYKPPARRGLAHNDDDEQDEQEQGYYKNNNNDDEEDGQEERKGDEVLNAMIKRVEAKQTRADKGDAYDAKGDDNDIDKIAERLDKAKKVGASSSTQQQIVELQLEVDEKNNTIRMQNIKKQALQNEIESMQQKLRLNENMLREIEQKERGVADEAEKYTNQIAHIIEKIEENKQLAHAKTLKAKELESENRQQYKELDNLKKELKKREQEVTKKDLKINRLQEDIEKVKIDMQQQKMAPLEKGGDARKVMEKLTNDNKRLERQIHELLQAFKKQLRLIDILKRQKTHLIAGQIFAYTEEEFVKVLEMGERV